MKLIKIREEHADTLFRWRNNKDIYKWCRQREPLDWQNHICWLKSLPNRSDVRMFAIEEPIKFNIIGVCGLTSIDLVNGSAEFSLYIGPEYMRNNFGESALRLLIKYGFEVLRLYHIFGETFADNPAAKMFKKVGFKFDGIRRGYYYREGKHIDAHLYSILSNEVK